MFRSRSLHMNEVFDFVRSHNARSHHSILLRDMISRSQSKRTVTSSLFLFCCCLEVTSFLLLLCCYLQGSLYLFHHAPASNFYTLPFSQIPFSILQPLTLWGSFLLTAASTKGLQSSESYIVHWTCQSKRCTCTFKRYTSGSRPGRATETIRSLNGVWTNEGCNPRNVALFLWTCCQLLALAVNGR
jgi:hypothetical protein